MNIKEMEVELMKCNSNLLLSIRLILAGLAFALVTVATLSISSFKIFVAIICISIFMTSPGSLVAAGWGTPVVSSDQSDMVLPSTGSYSSTQHLSSGAYSNSQQLGRNSLSSTQQPDTSPSGSSSWGTSSGSVSAGWGNVDTLNSGYLSNKTNQSGSATGRSGSGTGFNISPTTKMIDNPWFKASDFLPNPDEYKAPKASEKAAIKDTVINPVTVWIETVEKDGKKVRSNFKALHVNEEVFIPVITLPRMFKTKVQWKAAGQKLYIYKNASTLTFSLDGGLKIDFFGEDISFGERLIYYEQMLFVPVKAISEFFKYKVFWAPARKLLHFIKRVSTAPVLKKRWESTLKKRNLYNYANTLNSTVSSGGTDSTGTGRTGSTGSTGSTYRGQKQVFENRWGPSEEPQTIACKGLRGDWKLKSSDMAIALPSRKALMKKVNIRYRKTGRVVSATVVDVGPWNISDPYWVKDGGRPEAETNRSKFYSRGYNKTNLAGIDLAYEVWAQLGVSRSTAYSGNFSAYVDWWFE